MKTDQAEILSLEVKKKNKISGSEVLYSNEKTSLLLRIGRNPEEISFILYNRFYMFYRFKCESTDAKSGRVAKLVGELLTKDTCSFLCSTTLWLTIRVSVCNL